MRQTWAANIQHSLKLLATALVLLGTWVPGGSAGHISLYTYELPWEYTEEVANMPIDREEYPWTSWYDLDQVKSLSFLH